MINHDEQRAKELSKLYNSKTITLKTPVKTYVNDWNEWKFDKPATIQKAKMMDILLNNNYLVDAILTDDESAAIASLRTDLHNLIYRTSAIVEHAESCKIPRKIKSLKNSIKHLKANISDLQSAISVNTKKQKNVSRLEYKLKNLPTYLEQYETELESLISGEKS